MKRKKPDLIKVEKPDLIQIAMDAWQERFAQNANIVNEQGRLIQFYRDRIDAMVEGAKTSDASWMENEMRRLQKDGEARFEELKDILAPPVF